MLSTPILLACILVMVATAFLLILQKTSGSIVPGSSTNINRAPTFIIAGLSNSGKTSLFNLLTLDAVKPTVMSQESNVADDYMLPSSHRNFRFKLVDFPGHFKFRSELLSLIRESPQLKGLLFVVDSTTNPKNMTEVAELLYELINVTERRPDGVDILLACNKSESFTARPPLKVKTALENEIQEIIARKIKSLKSTSTHDSSDDDDVDDDAPLLHTQYSTRFTFDRMDGNVDALDGSVLKENIDKWECWIDERAMN